VLKRGLSWVSSRTDVPCRSAMVANVSPTSARTHCEVAEGAFLWRDVRLLFCASAVLPIATKTIKTRIVNVLGFKPNSSGQSSRLKPEQALLQRLLLCSWTWPWHVEFRSNCSRRHRSTHERRRLGND